MSAAAQDHFEPLTGAPLLAAALVLALTNFMVVLDTTITNVTVPHIAGSLAISPNQGTWIITSYAVAEAICVPLTGWLAGRFGTVRTFVWGMIGFGVFSTLCGFSNSLTMLIICRIGQGFAGGPLMPLSQTLLRRVFKPELRAKAMGLWAMTTITAPILGPITGGWISDSFSWHWIFFINIPVALFCGITAWRVLMAAESPIEKLPIDKVGLGLLITWIGALQLLVDLGRERGWFQDTFIVLLAITAILGFIVFVIWELFEEHPIVDLRVFRHRGFTVGLICMSISFGLFFSTSVIVPQWLQISMGYTATMAGIAASLNGVAALMVAPIVVMLSQKHDPRRLIYAGVSSLGIITLMRVNWATNADFYTIALPQFLQGFCMPFFFLPINLLMMGAVDMKETASAAGLMNFVRTMSCALATAVIVSNWDESQRVARSDLVGHMYGSNITHTLANSGIPLDTGRAMVEAIVDKESLMQATNYIFLTCAVLFIVAAASIWLVPKPRVTSMADMEH